MGVHIDGVHILVSDKYAKMKKREAIDDMLKQGFVPGETEEVKRKWAADAYDVINPKKLSPEIEKE